MTPDRVADLYRSERRLLARSVARIAGPDQAEDLVHDAFVAFLASDPDAIKPGAWLSRVARNRALNQVRRLRPLPLAEATVAAADHTSDPANPGAHPGSGAEREATRAVVAGTLASLPDRSRLALQLRFFEGRSYEEVAEALGVRVAQAHVVVHRAVRRFGRELVWRIAGAHGALDCAAGIAVVAGFAANDVPPHEPCTRCRPVWDELAALRALPSLTAIGAGERLRAFIQDSWRRSARFAEPAGHVAQTLAAVGIAVASVAGTNQAVASISSATRARTVEPATSAPAKTKEAVSPAMRSAVAPTGSRAVPSRTTTTLNSGPVRVTSGDRHTQVETQPGQPGSTGVVVCKPLEPCPPAQPGQGS